MDSDKPLADRIAHLAQQVHELQERVSRLEQFSPSPVVHEDSNELQEVRKPGPKPKISDEDLFRRRDQLLAWLEPYWPWLEEHIMKGNTKEKLRAIFEAIAEEPGSWPEYQQHFLDHLSYLHDFIWNERYRKTKLPPETVEIALDVDANPEARQRAANQFPIRQIVNAMAGVPEDGWRRSLDRCSKEPATHYVQMNVDILYRQKHGLAMPNPNDRDFTGTASPLPKTLAPFNKTWH